MENKQFQEVPSKKKDVFDSPVFQFYTYVMAWTIFLVGIVYVVRSVRKCFRKVKCSHCDFFGMMKFKSGHNGCVLVFLLIFLTPLGIIYWLCCKDHFICLKCGQQNDE